MTVVEERRLLNSSLYFRTARGPDRGMPTPQSDWVEVFTKVVQETLIRSHDR